MIVSTWLLVGAVGKLAAGIAPVAWWRAGRKGLWGAMALGLLAWTIGVALKVAWAVPTNKAVLGWFARTLPATLAPVVSHAYIGMLTGVFECGLVLLIAWRTRLRQADWAQAMAYGLGKGGGEAAILGLVALFQAVVIAGLGERATSQLTPEQHSAVVQMATAASACSAIVERLAALAAHALSSVLIVYGLRVRQQRWFWLSFLYLGTVDALAAWGIAVYGSSLPLRPLFFAYLALISAVGLAGLRLLGAKFPPAPEPGAMPGVAA
jgi:uncharacterized membrane protein YhfC